jgi:hypothetical protein
LVNWNTGVEAIIDDDDPGAASRLWYTPTEGRGETFSFSLPARGKSLPVACEDS